MLFVKILSCQGPWRGPFVSRYIVLASRIIGWQEGRSNRAGLHIPAANRACLCGQGPYPVSYRPWALVLLPYYVLTVGNFEQGSAALKVWELVLPSVKTGTNWERVAWPYLGACL